MRLGQSIRGLSTLYGASLTLSFGHGMAIPTIPLMVEYFDISVFWGAQIITAWAVGALLGTPPAGMITDRFGARVPLLVGPVLITAAGLGIVLAPSFWLVLPAMMVAGMGHSSWMIGREIAGVELVATDQRGRMMSGFMGTNAAGMALGPRRMKLYNNSSSQIHRSITWRGLPVYYSLAAECFRTLLCSI